MVTCNYEFPTPLCNWSQCVWQAHIDLGAHTYAPRLQAMGCASPPHLGVQNPLPTPPHCGSQGCPQPHVILGPHHLLPLPEGDPAPQAARSRGTSVVAVGELEVAAGSIHGVGVGTAKPQQSPRGHVRQGHTSPDGCCFLSGVSPSVTSVYSFFIILFRLVPSISKILW